MEKIYYRDITRAQEKLYIYAKINKNDPCYNMIYAYKIEGNLDVERFKHVVDIYIKHIDVAKVNFVEKDKKVMQYVDLTRQQELNIIEYKDLTRNEFYQKVNKDIKQVKE